MIDGRAYLLWRAGPLAGSKVPIDRDYFIIGRDPDHCHLVIEVDIISRQHAALKTDEHGAATLIDLFSRNGTYLDGKHVTQHALKDGAQISLGRDGSVAFTYYAAVGKQSASAASRREEPSITLAQSGPTAGEEP